MLDAYIPHFLKWAVGKGSRKRGCEVQCCCGENPKPSVLGEQRQKGPEGGSSGLSLLAGFWPVLATQGFQLEMSEDEGMQQAGKQGRDLG